MTDRLAELTAGTGISLQEALEEIDIESGDDQLDAEAQEALAKYRKETDALSQAIDQVHEKIETIESRYQITLDSHVDESDKAIASNDIARLLNQTEKTSDAIRKRLRRIAGENKTFAAENPNKTGELRVRVNTHTGLTRRFMDAMQVFEESQERHRDNVKVAMERHLRVMNPQASEDEILDALRNGATDAIVDDSRALNNLPLEEQMRLKRGLADLKGRNNDIKKLEESIIQLHQLFVDMQILVEAQGELLNDIEYNIVDTKGKTEVGLQELVHARAHQKSAHRKMICFIILVLMLLCVVLIPVLIKFIPKWFPSTQDTIDGLPIFGNSTGSSGESSEPPPEIETSARSNNGRHTRNYEEMNVFRLIELKGNEKDSGPGRSSSRPLPSEERMSKEQSTATFETLGRSNDDDRMRPAEVIVHVLKSREKKARKARPKVMKKVMDTSRHSRGGQSLPVMFMSEALRLYSWWRAKIRKDGVKRRSTLHQESQYSRRAVAVTDLCSAILSMC